jgi:hypothetical protein
MAQALIYVNTTVYAEAVAYAIDRHTQIFMVLNFFLVHFMLSICVVKICPGDQSHSDQSGQNALLSVNTSA